MDMPPPTPESSWIEAMRNLGPLAAALLPLVMLFRQVREPVARYLWRPIRSRIVTPRDVRRDVDGLANAIGAKLDDVLAELRPAGRPTLREEIGEVRAKTEENSALMSLFASNVEYGVAKTDDAGAWVWANDTLLRLLERSLSDVIGLGWVTAVHEMDQRRVRTGLDTAMQDRREYRTACVVVDRRGNEVPVDMLARPVRTQQSVKIPSGYIIEIRRRHPQTGRLALPVIDED